MQNDASNEQSSSENPLKAFGLANDLQNKGDLDGAVALIMPWAKHGSGLMQLEVGIILEERNSAPTDLVDAVSWFRRAARQGLPFAQWNLARCLFHGIGCVVDTDEAIRWYKRSSEGGCGQAAKDLGYIMANSDNDQRDLKVAYLYFFLGWMRGSSEAGDALDEVLPFIERSEIPSMFCQTVKIIFTHYIETLRWESRFIKYFLRFLAIKGKPWPKLLTTGAWTDAWNNMLGVRCLERIKVG